jgi:hypothetical protein
VSSLEPPGGDERDGRNAPLDGGDLVVGDGPGLADLSAVHREADTDHPVDERGGLHVDPAFLVEVQKGRPT